MCCDTCKTNRENCNAWCVSKCDFPNWPNTFTHGREGRPTVVERSSLYYPQICSFVTRPGVATSTTPLKVYGGVEVQSHIFLISALAAGEWSASLPCRFTPGERAHGTHWIGGWVDTRAGPDDLQTRKFLTLPGLELRPLSRPARSESLYRLHFTSSC
jgi:hypothetical protein